MQRTKIGEKNHYFIGQSGLKRIARARKNQVTENDIIKPVTKKLPVRKVDDVDGGIVVVLHVVNGNFGNKEQEILYIAQALAKDTPVLAICFGKFEHHELIKGADRVLILDDEPWLQYQPEAKLATLENIRQTYKPKHFLFADSVENSDLARRFAIKFNLSFAADIVEITENTIIRLVKSHTKQQVLSTPDVMCIADDLRQGELEYVCEATPLKNAVRIENKPEQSLSQVKNNAMALEEADFICAAGNGINDVDIFSKFANSLGAAIGASRVVVDDGKFAKSRQIGATGVSVQSNIYVAIGISGAIQHLQGIENCNKVVTINTDPNCQMVKRANLSIIHDADELMTQVMQLLEKEPK